MCLISKHADYYLLNFYYDAEELDDSNATVYEERWILLILFAYALVSFCCAAPLAFLSRLFG